MKREEIILSFEELNNYNFENRIVNIAFYPMTDDDVIDNSLIVSEIADIVESAIFTEEERKDIEAHKNDTNYLNEKYADKIAKASKIIDKTLSALYLKDVKCVQKKKSIIPIIVGKKNKDGNGNECYFVNRKNNGDMSGWLILKDFVHNRFVDVSPIPRWFLNIVINSISELKKLNENIDEERLYVIEDMLQLDDNKVKIVKVYPFIENSDGG